MNPLMKFLVALPALSATVALAQEDTTDGDQDGGLLGGLNLGNLGAAGIVVGLIVLFLLWRFVFRRGD